MSKHVMTDEDDCRIVVHLHPSDDPKQRGWRLRLERMDGEMAVFASEEVLPERVDNPRAQRVVTKESHSWLTRDEAVWLRGALDDLLAEWPRE